MTLSKILKIALLAGIGFLDLAASDKPSMLVSYSFVSPAQAVVGRPLTPVSVAGAARRTVRRRAAGVYNC